MRLFDGNTFWRYKQMEKMQFKNAAKIAAEICPILITIIKLNSFYRVHLRKAAEVFRRSPLNFRSIRVFPVSSNLVKEHYL